MTEIHIRTHTHTCKHNKILCSFRHSFDTITFLRVIMNLFRKLDCGNRRVGPRTRPLLVTGWERRLGISLRTPVTEMSLLLYLPFSPRLSRPSPPPPSPSLSHLSFSHTPAASFDLWGPLEPWKAIPAFAVRQNPVENLLDVSVCPGCNPSCWHDSLRHTICQRLNLNSATQSPIIDNATSNQQSFHGFFY